MQEGYREQSLDMHCQESRSLLGEASQTGTWDRDLCAKLMQICYLTGPPILVIRREMRKVAMVARIKVLGKVLR